MAESKYLKKVQGNGASTTLSASMSDVATSASLTADTAFAGEGMVIIDEGQATEEFAYATAKIGSTLTTLAADRGLEGGSAQAHASTATVKGIITAGMWNNLITGVTNVLVNTTGALDTTKVVDLTTAQTLTNKTLTTPKIASFYQDAGGTKLMTTPNTASDTLAAIAATQTLTNKRITPRVLSATSYTTDTGTSLNCDTTDIFIVTAQAGALKFNNPSGTPTDGQKLWIAVTGTGARALTYDTQFEASGAVALPTTTVTTNRLDIGFVWVAATSKWRCVASA